MRDIYNDMYIYRLLCKYIECLYKVGREGPIGPTCSRHHGQVCYVYRAQYHYTRESLSLKKKGKEKNTVYNGNERRRNDLPPSK